MRGHFYSTDVTMILSLVESAHRMTLKWLMVPYSETGLGLIAVQTFGKKEVVGYY